MLLRLIVWESIQSFIADRGFQAAATLAFYGFLAMPPLLLLAVVILGVFVQSSQGVTDVMATTISQVLPTFDQTIIAELVKLSSNRIWGIIGVGFLVVSVVPFAGTIRDTLGRVLKVGNQIGFLKSWLVDGAGAIALLLLVVLLTGSNVVAVLAQHTSLGTPVAIVLRHAGLFLVTVIVLSFFYLMFSYPTLVRPSHLLCGSVVAAVLLALIRPVFGLVLEYNPNYGYMFGSLKAVFLLVVWIYYAFCAIFLGAEAMASSLRREALLLRRLFLQREGAQVWIRILQRFLRVHARGESIIREGEPGHEMFCILDGEVVLRKGGVVLKTMHAGEYFGEMSMLLDVPRTATATAGAGGAVLAAISRSNFDTILRENPAIVRGLLQEMARRLMHTSQRLC